MVSVGLPLTSPFTPSSVMPSYALKGNIITDPHDIGIQLSGCWNATLEDCYVTGYLGDEQEYANPTRMQVGIDLVGAMDCHIERPRVTSAGIGIRASTHGDGFPRCEGFHLDKGWLMHVNSGVQLNGSQLGGWSTPWSTISNTHIAFNTFAVRADQQAFLHINNVNCYGSHYSTVKWAIHLTNCKNVVITDCDFWSNWTVPGFLVGISLSGCENVEITGGTFVDSIAVALHADGTCKNVHTNGKVWDRLQAQGKVFNHST